MTGRQDKAYHCFTCLHQAQCCRPSSGAIDHIRSVKGRHSHAQVPEHTWGVDVKTYLPDTANWANWQFQDELASNAEDYTYIQVGEAARAKHPAGAGCSGARAGMKFLHFRACTRAWQ